MEGGGGGGGGRAQERPGEPEEPETECLILSVVWNLPYSCKR